MFAANSMILHDLYFAGLGRQPAILALDMFEHASLMDYGAKAGGYVEAFMQAIRWSNADSLYVRYGSS